MIENSNATNKGRIEESFPASIPSGPGDSLAGRVAGATGALALLALFGKGLGLVRELVIARHYGAGADLDAYLVALTVPEMGAYIALYVSLNAFLPCYVAERERSAAGANRLASAFWSRASLILFLVSGLIALLSGPVVTLLAPDLPPEERVISIRSLQILAWIIFFGGLQGTLRGILNTHRRFLVPTLGAILVSAVVIASVTLLSGRLGVMALTWGLLAGSAVPVLIVLPFGLRLEPRLFRSLRRSHPLLREVQRVLPWLLVIEVASLALPLVDRALASRFLEAGRISALSYSRILTAAPVDLIGITLATTLFPEFAAFHVRGDRERFQRMVRRGVRAALAAVLPVAVLLVVLRTPVIRIVYERGAFDAEATRLTAAALWGFAVGLPFVAASVIATQASYASGRLRYLLGVKVVALAAKIAVSLLLIDALGHVGIALGTSAFFAVVLLALVRPLAGTWAGLVPRPPVLALATAAAAGAGWILARGMAAAGIDHGPAAIPGHLAVWVVCGLVYLLVCRVGRIEEVLWVERAVLTRFGRGR